MAAVRPVALRFSARARSQLLAIHEYIAERNLAAAERVGDAISEAVEVLRYFPHSGRRGRVEGTREWVVRRYPYILVYDIDDVEEGVTILGVFHSAQKRE